MLNRLRRVSTLFPYTTLFRSPSVSAFFLSPATAFSSNRRWPAHFSPRLGPPDAGNSNPGRAESSKRVPISEEHTSELQSLAYLVCRLLLENKQADLTRRILLR